MWPAVVLGAGCVSGQVWGGLYTLSIWGPASLVGAACLVGLIVSRPVRPAANATVVLLSLLGLAGLSAMSMLWAESAPRASLEAHRWALYAGLLGVLLLTLRDERGRRAVVMSIGAAGAAVALAMAVILTFGDASRLFFGMRLTEPLGYVNGQAAAFAAAIWPALAWAEHGRRAVVRGAGAAAACLACGLLLLVQSRGAVLALVVTICFVLAVMPGRVRRGWLLLVVGAGVVAAAGPLLAVYSSTPSALEPADDVVHDAVGLLLVFAAAAGLAWAVATRLLEDDRVRRPSLQPLARWGLVVIAVAGIAVGTVRIGDPAAELRAQVEQFKANDTSGLAQSRLLGGGGHRYDYWRVAIEEFRSAPLLGVGAGNYPRDYFRLRGTTEDIRQPHSLQLQGLSELGGVGLVLVMTLLGGLLWACVSAARRVRDGRADAAVAVACSGLIVSWIVHTSVDWLHLLPSLTGVMICAFAALASAGSQASEATARRLPLIVVVVALTVLAAAGIGRLTLADKYRDDARTVLNDDPSRAAQLAGRALRLQADDVESLYVRAAAYARQDDYARARRDLLEAARAEPHNFVPPALLGDLALRREEMAVARASYRAAIRLNPRDVSLREAYARALAGGAP